MKEIKAQNAKMKGNEGAKGARRKIKKFKAQKALFSLFGQRLYLSSSSCITFDARFDFYRSVIVLFCFKASPTSAARFFSNYGFANFAHAYSFVT